MIQRKPPGDARGSRIGRFIYPNNHNALCSDRGRMSEACIALLHMYNIAGTRGVSPQKIGQSRGLVIVSRYGAVARGAAGRGVMVQRRILGDVVGLSCSPRLLVDAAARPLSSAIVDRASNPASSVDFDYVLIEVTEPILTPLRSGRPSYLRRASALGSAARAGDRRWRLGQRDDLGGGAGWPVFGGADAKP